MDSEHAHYTSLIFNGVSGSLFPHFTDEKPEARSSAWNKVN